jgi:hypothetical protein
MKSKRQYIAPELTVVSFRTERGYALSGAPDRSIFDFSLFEPEEGYNSQSQQNWYEEDESFFGSGW